jgi:hypothetical protein
MKKLNPITDKERIQFIETDDGLACMWRNSWLSKQGFVTIYRVSIDAVIKRKSKSDERT